MQSDFFEHPETTRLKQLSRRRQALLKELHTVGDEIQQTFRETNSWALNNQGTLRIITLPTGGTYIYELLDDKERDRHPVLMRVDLEFFISAANLLQKQQLAEDTIP